jgi:hypothetical protein
LNNYFGNYFSAVCGIKAKMLIPWALGGRKERTPAFSKNAGVLLG